jgi:hypothetical protein
MALCATRLQVFNTIASQLREACIKLSSNLRELKNQNNERFYLRWTQDQKFHQISETRLKEILTAIELSDTQENTAKSSSKDETISKLEDKIIALKGKIAGLDACICELNGELSTYNPLPGVVAILCDERKFFDGSLKKSAVNEMKFLLGREIRYEDDDLKELTTKILRILENELLINGVDSNFGNNGNLKKEAVDAIKAIVNKVYPDDKIN